MDFIERCPVCGNENLYDFLNGNDYFLSHENFTIQQCVSCGFKFTNPYPAKNNIGKYYNSEQYISHNSQKVNITTLAYKTARYFAIRKKFSIIKRFSKGNRLLDIGCGTGELLNYCFKNGFIVNGIEPNQKARQFAIESYRLNVSEDLKVENILEEKFDCITLWHVLEHFSHPTEELSDITSLLNPEGILIIAVPNCNSWDAIHYKQYWAAYDLPRHLSHFTYQTLKFFVEKNNFTLVEYLPQKLDAFYISLLSEKYMTGRKNFLKAIFRGLQSNYYGKQPEFNHSSIIFILTRKNSYF